VACLRQTLDGRSSKPLTHTSGANCASNGLGLLLNPYLGQPQVFWFFFSKKEARSFLKKRTADSSFGANTYAGPSV
jgi:hypothetical protein